MDIVDRAQEGIEHSDALAQQHRMPVAPVGAISAVDCVDCGLPIPAGRREAVHGTQHCAECAGLIERGLIR